MSQPFLNFYDHICWFGSRKTSNSICWIETKGRSILLISSQIYFHLLPGICNLNIGIVKNSTFYSVTNHLEYRITSKTEGFSKRIFFFMLKTLLSTTFSLSVTKLSKMTSIAKTATFLGVVLLFLLSLFSSFSACYNQVYNIRDIHFVKHDYQIRLLLSVLSILLFIFTLASTLFYLHGRIEVIWIFPSVSLDQLCCAWFLYFV